MVTPALLHRAPARLFIMSIDTAAGESLSAALASIHTPVATPASASPSSISLHGRSGVSKGELRHAILEAILAERARKQARRAAGLPDTESSSDESDSDDDPVPRRRTAKQNASPAPRVSTTAAPEAAVNKADYGVAQYWDSRYTKSVTEHLLAPWRCFCVRACCICSLSFPPFLPAHLLCACVYVKDERYVRLVCGV